MKFVLLINLSLLPIAKSFLRNMAERVIFCANEFENAIFCYYLLAGKCSCAAEFWPKKV